MLFALRSQHTILLSLCLLLISQSPLLTMESPKTIICLSQLSIILSLRHLWQFLTVASHLRQPNAAVICDLDTCPLGMELRYPTHFTVAFILTAKNNWTTHRRDLKSWDLWGDDNVFHLLSQGFLLYQLQLSHYPFSSLSGSLLNVSLWNKLFHFNPNKLETNTWAISKLETSLFCSILYFPW